MGGRAVHDGHGLHVGELDAGRDARVGLVRLGVGGEAGQVVEGGGLGLLVEAAADDLAGKRIFKRVRTDG